MTPSDKVAKGLADIGWDQASFVAAMDRLTDYDRQTAIWMLENPGAAWRPLPGPQSQAYWCPADITGYGGAAGGGKSDLGAGLIITQHKRSAVFRREKAQTVRMVQRLSDILNTTDGLNGQQGIWRLPGGGLLELAGLDNPGDERRWQGRDHDLKLYDEVTEMREDQVRYTMGWNRSDDPNVRVRVVMTFNPPTTTEGRWVIAFFGPWLDPMHPNPALPGELRWFTTIAGKDMEVHDTRSFVMRGETPVYDFDPADWKPEDIIVPRSRTFIPARVTDNPHLVRTGYISGLQAMPEPLRSQMLYGDFSAGIEDDPWQVIPTAWVDSAMARWQPRNSDRTQMDSLGVDVARGGRDETIIARRHGNWFDEMIALQGAATSDGPAVMAEVIRVRRDKAPVHVDVIGVGSSPYDLMKTNGVQAVACNGAESSGAQNREGTMAFTNKRAEWWWRMREALDPDGDQRVTLPPDQKLRADLCAPLWKLETGGIRIERKDEIVKRIGRSPDRGDAVCMALIATRKVSDVRYVPRGKGRSAWAA